MNIQSMLLYHISIQADPGVRRRKDSYFVLTYCIFYGYGKVPRYIMAYQMVLGLTAVYMASALPLDPPGFYWQPPTATDRKKRHPFRIVNRVKSRSIHIHSDSSMQSELLVPS